MKQIKDMIGGMKAAIFDVDGTLLDSMPIWRNAGCRYLQSLGIEAEENLSDILWTMSIPEGVVYLKKRYAIDLPEEVIYEGIVGTVRDFYYNEAELKPGMKEILDELKEAGIPMVIATSSDKSYLEAAFKRNGIDGYFQRIFTCKEVGAGKTRPDIYLAAAAYLQTRPEEILVFEDVLHAIRSARSAGFKIAAVYDAASASDISAIRTNGDVHIGFNN